MNFTFKKDKTLDDDEIVITHNSDSEVIDELHKFLNDQSKSHTPLIVYQNDTQYFMNMNDILFFETQDNVVYAHTHSDAYESTHRLYELEEILSSNFIRISKSTIVNKDKIMSISRYLTSSSIVSFNNSHKEVYVSRRYYQTLKQELERRTRL